MKVVSLNLTAGHRITLILKVLNIPKSTYYDYLHWEPSKTEIKRDSLKKEVLKNWLKYPMYGYRRMTKLVNDELNYSVSTYLIYRIMRHLGIQSRMSKSKKKPKTYTEVEQKPNLIKSLVDKSNVLLTDITYIPVRNRWVYLATLFNPETRRVISHKVGEHMTKELAASVIDPSKIKQLRTKIIHSDMGSQYTSELFEETLNQLKLKHSYSRKGCPVDNARIESFHSILKREYINFQCFQSLEEAILGIDTYIRWYNEERISLVS